ncbi:hypothetical protein [Chamaesiphon sp.]|uniref:hypothetical protein n=1 Tax=Chamaesiphon sp. TaxID=2814140 RepID=UPI003592ED0E
MNISEIPNVSTSAAAYLLQAAIELATEADFEPTSEAQMRQWIDRNSHAIAERAQELQNELLIKFYEHRQLINEAISTNTWEKVRQHEQTN